MKNNLLQKLIFLLTVFISFNLQAQPNYILKGKVSDAKGKAIAFVTIGIKGTNEGTVSQDDGTFTISTNAALPITLLVSGLSYQKKEIKLNAADQNINIQLQDQSQSFTEVVVSSRRRKEAVQDIPIPISVVSGLQVEESGSFNVNRVKELIPTVQLYSSNPRNTTLNIRGLGSTFGLTNDGIDPGVGFYVDGVYYARPAATTLDFIDIERIEVLRGPQGTLFGKNTTAGAFNIVTRAPSFTPGANFEVSYGNYGYIQAKSSVTGALGKSKKLAGCLSFSGTQRDGLIENVATQKLINDLNNIGIRGQILYTPNEKVKITFAADASRQRPDGYAQVIAGVAPTKRAAYRQFDQIIADLEYSLPSTNAFDRKVDHNTSWRSGNDLGGVSLNIDAAVGAGTFTSTSAWRYWNWDPSNDRDFTGLSVLALSQASSKHQQWSQEFRYAGNIGNKITGVVGLYALGQDLKTDPFHVEESGNAQWRFSQSTTSSLWSTPGLFDGYGIKTNSRLQSLGAAVFANVDWSITKKLHLLPGIRFNYDEKKVDYDRKTYGGLQTNDKALLDLKKLVYTDQAFKTDVNNQNLSGQLTLAYRANEKVNTFATYSTSYKPIGVNLGGLPTANGRVLIELAEVKPEYVSHFELGVKTTLKPGTTVNIVAHNTDIKDYQTLVQTAEVGVNRGYLANAERVSVVGVELDASHRISRQLSINGALAYTEGKYISFKNAPVPLEETGSAQAFKDISDGQLPGISKWAGSLGTEFNFTGKLLNQEGNYYLAIDTYARSGFSSSASPSAYLNIAGYALLNARFGFRAATGVSIQLWGRNLLNKNYYEQLLAAAGNAGHYAGVLGDPRTYGLSLRYSF